MTTSQPSADESAPPPDRTKRWARLIVNPSSGAQSALSQLPAITAALATQERIGLPILTDGEMRRRNFQDSFATAVSGFDVPRRVSYDLDASTTPFARAVF